MTDEELKDNFGKVVLRDIFKMAGIFVVGWVAASAAMKYGFNMKTDEAVRTGPALALLPVAAYAMFAEPASLISGMRRRQNPSSRNNHGS